MEIRSIFPKVCSTLLCVALAPLTTAAILPDGFEETVIETGIAATRLAWSESGDLWIATRYGEIWIRRQGTMILAATLDSDPQGERGIHGFTLDPDDPSTAWVFYTHLPTGKNRLSRFTIAADTLIDETPIFETPPLVFVIHNGGCLEFAGDGTIWLGTGDDKQGAVTAPDPFDIRGKILRMDRDGQAVPGGPYADAVAGDPLVWASGFRNPFRCNVQPGTENLFLGDVGQNKQEELNIIVPGGDYGWPYVEGASPFGQTSLVYPIHAYTRVGGSAAIVGGDHAEAGDFAPHHEGDYFFGDYGRDEIYRMRLDETNRPISTEVWATDAPGPAYLAFGPDGALYYSSIGAAQVRKIEYLSAANHPPVAEAVIVPDAGPAPLATTLDGAASFDPDLDSLTWSWDLGDDSSGSGSVFAHSYAEGVYEPVLTVEDPSGAQSKRTGLRVVAGNSRPQPTIAQPLPSAFYDAGQAVSFSGSAVDPEDGGLSCPRLRWTVTRNEPGEPRTVLGPVEGVCGGSFDVDDREDPSTLGSYEIRLEARDTGSPVGPDGVLTGSATVAIQPNLSSFTLDATPSVGLTLKLDGQPVTPPANVDGVVGFHRIVDAASPQLAADGHTYRWLSWSDAGDEAHEIVTPASPSTFTATFGCNVLEAVTDVQTSPIGGGQVQITWQAVGDPCLAPGPVRYRVYAGSIDLPPDLPCDFPTSPAYVEIGTSMAEQLIVTPAVGQDFFRVVAIGTDGLEGPLDCTDRDADGEVDPADNCPDTANPLQEDGDGDGVGDACDNCPASGPADQTDGDGDGIGDVCDPCPSDASNDGDGDTICGSSDNCPTDANPDQTDGDGDDIGDACDICPGVQDADQPDADGDGIGDACDPCTDVDGDGRGDPTYAGNTCLADNCLDVMNPSQEDDDADGVGNACDPCTDSDGDGFGDPGNDANGCLTDNCPATNNPDQLDTDNDDIGNVCDVCPGDPLNDDDGDTVCHASDNCPSTANLNQLDTDNDQIGDACDACVFDALNDTDGDGFCGDVDICPFVADPDQEDSDLDTVGNACDNCPDVSNLSQLDAESDGVGDLCDNCPATANFDQADVDADTEGDACDLDDGLIFVRFASTTTQDWDDESGFDSWNLYRGSLAELRSSGTYTQAPGSNFLAAQWCGVAPSELTEGLPLPLGSAVFYLVTGVASGVEGGLGSDSEMTPRPNDAPCP